MTALRPDETNAWRALASALQEAGDDGAVDAWTSLLAIDGADGQSHDALAILHAARGDPASAAVHARALAEASPQDDAAWSRLAGLLDQSGDAAGAVEAWRQVVGLDPSDLAAHARLADLYGQFARPQDAVGHLRTIAEASPQVAARWITLARALQALGSPEDAIDAWRRVLTIGGADTQAHDQLARLYADLKRPADAVPHLRFLAERDPGRGKLWKRLAQTQRAAGDKEGAVETWRRLTEIPASEIEAQSALGEALSELGWHAEAAAAFRVVADAEPAKAQPARRLAQAFRAAGDLDAAADAWRRLLALPEAEAEAHAELGGMLFDASRHAEAIPHLRFIADREGGRLKPWKRLAQSSKAVGDAEGATLAWRKVLEIGGAESEAHNTLAGLLHGLGRTTEALPHFEALTQEQPDQPKPWLRLAQIHQELGDRDAALASLRAALGAGPDERSIHEALITLLNDLDRRHEALVHVRRVAELAPAGAKPWRRLALASRRAKDFDGAVAAWRHMLSIPAVEAEARESLVELLISLGRHAEAAEHLRHLAEQQPQAPEGWRRLAETLRAAQDVEGVIDAVLRLLAISETEAEADAELGGLYFDLGRHAEATPHLRATAAREKGRLKPWKRLAQSLKATGDNEGAVAAWTEVLTIGGAESEANNQLAGLLLGLDRKAEALPYLKAIAEEQPTDVKPWTRLAQAAQQAGDAPMSIEAWNRIVEIAPQDRAARDALIALLVGQGREGDALQHSRALAEANPQDLKVWRRLAIAARAAQEREISVEAWRHVLEIGGADAEAHGHLGDMLFEMRRPAEAAPHLKAMAQAQPDRLKPWKRLADTLQGLEDFPGAAEALEAVLKIGDDPQVRERLAGLLLRIERPQEAATQLRLLAQASPKETHRWEQLARALTAAQDTAGTIAAWRKVLALDRQSKPAHIELAQLFNDLGQHAAAAPHLRWLAKRAPDDLKIQRRLGRALQVIGEAQGAMDTWKEVLRLEPQDAEASLALAVILQGLGRHKEAILYQRSAAYDSGDPKIIRRFARSAQDLGDLDEAKAAWTRILALAPGDTEAHQQLAGLAQTTGNEDEAAFHLLWIAQNKGTDERLWKRVAKVFGRLKRTDEAAAAWRRVFEIAPNELDLHKTLADLFEQAEDFAKAEPHLRWLIEHGDGETGAAWARLARSLGRNGDADGEIAAWREILSIRPDDADAHNRLASLYKQQGDLATAATFLRALADQEPTKVKPWRRLANHFAEAGDAEAEVDIWRTVLAISPDDAEAQGRLAELLTDLYLPAQALPLLQAIAERSADVAKHWQRVARAVQKSQGPQEALAAWERVLDLRPDDLEAHENVVRLLDSLGRGAEATPHLRLLADAGPRRLELWRRLSPVGEGVEAEIAWWKRVLALTPDDRTLLERLSLFLYGLGRKAEALPYFRELARLEPEDALVWRRLARCLDETGDDAGAREAWGMVSMVAGEDGEAEGRLGPASASKPAGRSRPSSRPAAASGQA